MKEGFEERLKALPTRPGVYLFRDERGNVIYVGKASSLRNRVRSYFGAPQTLSTKHQRMVRRTSDFDFFITDSEQEAILLESNLIKKLRPRYNVRLKDDKTFPYLKIDTREDWPRVYITRRLEGDGSRYFGPFASAGSIRKTMSLLRRLFPFRTCTRTITGNDPRPCLDYYIHRCLGPCIGRVTREEYQSVIDQVILFLEGRQEQVIRELRDGMEAASEGLDFERAATLRDQIKAIESIGERQKITSLSGEDEDVIAYEHSKDHAYVEAFFIRGGKLIGREHFILEGTQDEEPGQIMTSFIKQFYGSSPYIPPLILLQNPADEMGVIQGWLQTKRGARVRLQVPKRGEKKRLIEMVAENARQGLEQLKVKQLSAPDSLAQALEELRESLSLPRIPRRVECYDISDIGGTSAVGSMVVFEDGRPKSSHYRRFRIKTVEGIDDYAMIQEVLRRRFKHAASAGDGWAITPDLVLIDGGRGHLNAALEVMEELKIDSVPVASIAKENEDVFVPHIQEPISLPPTSPALYLLERIRDEAHRFALLYHRRVRSGEAFASALDAVPGIGPKRKKALLRRFGSLRGIKEAPIDEVAAVTGMTRSLAERVKEYI